MRISARKFFKNFAEYQSKEDPSVDELNYTEEQQKFLNLFSATEIEEVNNISFEEVLEFFNPNNLGEFYKILQFENDFLERFSQFQARLGTMEGIKIKRRRIL